MHPGVVDGMRTTRVRIEETGSVSFRGSMWNSFLDQNPRGIVPW